MSYDDRTRHLHDALFYHRECDGDGCAVWIALNEAYAAGRIAGLEEAAETINFLVPLRDEDRTYIISRIMGARSRK